MSFSILICILAAVTLSACAQLALKIGVSNITSYETIPIGLIETTVAYFLSPMIWLGFVVYAISMGIWLWVLSKVDLSIAYPFVGVSFIVTLFFGVFLLKEDITLMRVIGILFIVIGCIFIGRDA